MNPAFDRYDREAIRERLEHGDFARIADRVPCHRSTVYRFFKGYGNNYRILEVAADLLDERKNLRGRFR